MEEYKTRMIEEYGDLVKKYYKLKAFLEVEKGQRHLEAMDRSLLREQLHYMGGYLEVLVRRITRLFCTPDFESEAAADVSARPGQALKTYPLKNEAGKAVRYVDSGNAGSCSEKAKKVTENGDTTAMSADDFIKWFNQHFN